MLDMGYPDLAAAEPVPEPAYLRFHDNHGENVELSNRHKIAERVKGHNHGTVLLRYPMLINRLYEVRLDKKDPSTGDSSCFFYCGVTFEPPESLCLPAGGKEWGFGVVVNNNHVTFKGQYKTGNPVGKKLENLPQGSRVGLAVDDHSSLRLYVNGEDQGVVIGLGVPVPCYAFFDLSGPYRKIATLPIRPLKLETNSLSTK